VFIHQTFLKEEDELNSKLVSIQNAEQASDASIHEVIKDIVKLSELLKYAREYYSFANSREKEKIIRTIFSELSISGDMLKYKCKNGFQALENRFISSCDLTGNRTPI
jgi:hypothetical protein